MVDDKQSFNSMIKLSIKMFLCTARILSLLCFTSALHWLIHTYVSQMRQRQELLGWNVCLLLRGKERVSAFLNVKLLWLEKHTTYYACDCSLGGGEYGCGGGKGGTCLWLAGLGGESRTIDPGDTATIISNLIVDWSKRPQTGRFHKIFSHAD